EVLFDHQPEQYGAAVDAGLDRFVVGPVGDDRKVLRAAETVDEIAALLGVVHIVDRRRNAVHVQRQRIAEQDQQQHRERQRHGQAQGVTDDVPPLFVKDGNESTEAHLLAASCASIAVMKTSSIVEPGPRCAFNSAGVPSAMTRPRSISASRWQYSASSM